jgi:hypothetical protein
MFQETNRRRGEARRSDLMFNVQCSMSSHRRYLSRQREERMKAKFSPFFIPPVRSFVHGCSGGVKVAGVIRDH